MAKIKYYDYYSITILIVLTLICFTISAILFWLGSVWLVFGIILIVKYFSILNYVIYINDEMIVFKYFRIKNIKLSDITNLRCKITGFGSSRDRLIYIDYLQKGKIKETKLLHFRLLNYSKLIKLLNTLDKQIPVDHDSFKMIGIIWTETGFKKMIR